MSPPPGLAVRSWCFECVCDSLLRCVSLRAAGRHFLLRLLQEGAGRTRGYFRLLQPPRPLDFSLTNTSWCTDEERRVS